MENQEFKRKQNRNLLIVGIICLVGIIGIVGYTYSFFQVEDKDTGTITGTVASASLSVEVEKLAPDVDKALVPQLDTAIEAAVVGTQGNCIDDNHNAVCQVYSITVQNTSSIAINIDGLLRLNAGSNPNLKWTLIDSYADGMTSRPNVVGDINPHQITTLTANETYAASQEKTYYLVVWISETNYVQADTGEFTGTVTFKDSEAASASSNTLYALGIAPNTETPSFDKTSCSSGCGEATVGVYSYPDDLGTSYYFRGDVENNYVKFGKWNENTPDIYYGYFSVTNTTAYQIYDSLEACQNAISYNKNCTLYSRAGKDMYWRIIRINGDGTIRMIYDGTTTHANGESSIYRYITRKAFNAYVSGDNAYVGYMYGRAGVTAIGEAGYNQTHSNQTDSTIKAYLEDTWYGALSSTDKTKIADAIYCNDRSLDTSNASYTGIGTTFTYYAPYQRLQRNTVPEPKLICENKNDRFTYNASVGGVEGNDKLEAPVGLITADEVAIAGGVAGTSNSGYYLYSGNWDWTMSPSYVDGDAYLFFVDSSGRLDYFWANFDYGVRAVVSLSSTAITGGKGTISEPFTTN